MFCILTIFTSITVFHVRWQMVALPPDKKILHSSSIYVILFYGQNIQNDRKKELFFSPRSCGVSFCPGVSRGFLIADYTINRRAELFLHRSDGLWPDVAVLCGSCPFLQLSDQRGSAGQLIHQLNSAYQVLAPQYPSASRPLNFW